MDDLNILIQQLFNKAYDIGLVGEEVYDYVYLR